MLNSKLKVGVYQSFLKTHSRLKSLMGTFSNEFQKLRVNDSLSPSVFIY